MVPLIEGKAWTRDIVFGIICTKWCCNSLGVRNPHVGWYELVLSNIWKDKLLYILYLWLVYTLRILCVQWRNVYSLSNLAIILKLTCLLASNYNQILLIFVGFGSAGYFGQVLALVFLLIFHTSSFWNFVLSVFVFLQV